MVHQKLLGILDPHNIAIGSAKLLSSTPYEHLHDLQQLEEITELASIMKDRHHEIKHIRIITCDGGLDENLCYEKTIDCEIVREERIQ